MKVFNFIAVILLNLSILSCADAKKDGATEPEVKSVDIAFEHKATKIEATFRDDSTAAIFKRYIALKTALINADVPRAGTDAYDLMNLMINNGAEVSTVQELKKIMTSDDIEVQRTAFVGVSEAVELLLQDAIESGEVYKQYCPMAFNNKGAFWLSESKEIANPFFGEKMYRCGRIDSVLE